MASRQSDTGGSTRKTGRGKDGGTGAFAGTQHGGGNDGVSSAKPQVITGQEDASFKTETDAATSKDAGKDI